MITLQNNQLYKKSLSKVPINPPKQVKIAVQTVVMTIMMQQYLPVNMSLLCLLDTFSSKYTKEVAKYDKNQHVFSSLDR
jgi:hypothetical protein